MSILGAVIVPHPPHIIPSVGCGMEDVQTTINAYRTATKQAAVWNPEALIITSPHQAMKTILFGLNDWSRWCGKRKSILWVFGGIKILAVIVRELLSRVIFRFRKVPYLL